MTKYCDNQSILLEVKCTAHGKDHMGLHTYLAREFGPNSFTSSSSYFEYHEDIRRAKISSSLISFHTKIKNNKIAIILYTSPELNPKSL